MVLDRLGSGLKDTFKRIAGLGVVDKKAVEMVIRDLQRVLLQSDVDVKMVFEMTTRIKERILKEKPPTGLTLKEYFIRVLYDELVAFLGEEQGSFSLKPQKILLIGLFASGKTTTAGKLAKWFKTRGLSPALVGCDVHRPAAREQLSQLAEKMDVPVYIDGKTAEETAENALSESKEDVIIFDSAGRNALDEELAAELRNLGEIIKPDEVLLVIPADIGQAARRQAEEFSKLVGITGIIITKMDGTAKAGGALAAAAASGAKVKFMGVGEKPADLEQYDPKRFVSKLIGYGDIQGLIEKAKNAGFNEDAAKRMMEGKFTLNEFYEQLKSMQGMGSLSKMLDMIPGLSSSGLMKKMPAGFMDVQEEKMKKWKYAIDSMTPEERENPDIIKNTRISRIAKGSGTKESDIRDLLKNFKQIKKVMKMAGGGKGLKRGPLARLMKQMGVGGI
ncbi:MAG: signal recognition particle protein [Candidatus Micrarchaeota archaeon]|nr:signal recognition particle protein [Candidatus Micrarchaeota archaeon]